MSDFIFRHPYTRPTSGVRGLDLLHRNGSGPEPGPLCVACSRGLDSQSGHLSLPRWVNPRSKAQLILVDVYHIHSCSLPMVSSGCSACGESGTLEDPALSGSPLLFAHVPFGINTSQQFCRSIAVHARFHTELDTDFWWLLEGTTPGIVRGVYKPPQLRGAGSSCSLYSIGLALESACDNSTDRGGAEARTDSLCRIALLDQPGQCPQPSFPARFPSRRSRCARASWTLHVYTVRGRCAPWLGKVWTMMGFPPSGVRRSCAEGRRRGVACCNASSEATDPAEVEDSIDRLKTLRSEAKAQLQKHCGPLGGMREGGHGGPP